MSAPAAEAILERLAQIVGREALLVDKASRAEYAHDIFAAGETPLCAVRPASAEALQAVVRACAGARAPMTVRGGGASYTLSHTPARPGTVVIDTARLTGVTVNAGDMTVAVEAGVTWAGLDEALKPHGLRTPFWGSFSGGRATVLGSLSQHAISLGSGVYGASDQSVIALEVITGEGERLHTANPANPFHRSFGPDLTGLFLGDSGALGVKVRAILRLIRRPAHVAACSFAYPAFEPMAEALMQSAKLGAASENVAIDPELQKGQLAASGGGDLASAARAVLASAAGPMDAARRLRALAGGARDFLSRPSFSAHFSAEGHTAAEAKAKLASVRAAAASGGAEIAPALPLTLRAQPWRPFTILGADGFRWLPMHGVLPFSRVHDFHAAAEALYAEQAEAMGRLRVRMATMFLTVGSNAFVYEPTFYWPDAQNPSHARLMDPKAWGALPTLPADPEARALVKDLKRQLIELFRARNAVHYQIGKSYPYLSTLDEGARRLMTELKRALDPHGLLNPGALEFPEPSEQPAEASASGAGGC